MADAELKYDRMVESALRGVVREALAVAAGQGLPGSHHFYITFRTGHAGVSLPDHLVTRFPREMTIVLQHQFWDLEVDADRFAVTLSFNDKHERLLVPFAAVTAFADPSVRFGLQFEAETAEGEAGKSGALAVTEFPAERGQAGQPAAGEPPDHGAPEAPAGNDGEAGKVITLDSFRKK